MSDSICLQCENKRICATGAGQPSLNITIRGCSRFEQKRKQTNADRFRSMTDEELAEMFSGGKWLNCPPDVNCLERDDGFLKCWLDWLKQEAKDTSTTKD